MDTRDNDVERCSAFAFLSQPYHRDACVSLCDFKRHVLGHFSKSMLCLGRVTFERDI